MHCREDPQESCSAISRRTRGCPRSTRFARSSGTPVLASMTAEFDRIYDESGRRVDPAGAAAQGEPADCVMPAD